VQNLYSTKSIKSSEPGRWIQEDIITNQAAASKLKRQKYWFRSPVLMGQVRDEPIQKKALINIT
jgi:hypothetical protein